ncbi:MAG: hypothetical protein JST36_04845 [Bacteroidetes bacterium]|nr:hypothetical protein [Bacteroidota bacterium]
MKKIIIPVLALGLGLMASCKGGGEKIDLKLNLQPGTQYLYSMNTKMEMTQSAMGQTMKTNNDMIMDFVYDVTAAEGTNKKITVTYDRIAMQMKSQMANLSYDSKDTANSSPELGMMGYMLHKPFNMLVSEKGEILKVEGLQAIINSMGDSTSEAGLQMRKQLATSFNDSSMKGMLQQSLNFFPDKPVSVGDTWKRSYSMNMSIMSVNMDNEYKLASVDKGIAHIEVNSKLTGGGDITGTEEMKNVKVDLKGDQKGTMDVEIASGLVVNSSLKQDIKGDISMMGMKIPLTMNQDITITAKKK